MFPAEIANGLGGRSDLVQKMVLLYSQ